VEITSNIPKLRSSKIYQEYTNATKKEISLVVYNFLFNGFSYRELDKYIFGFNHNIQVSYNSLYIIHSLGLYDIHKNLFSNVTLKKAISEIDKNEKYKNIFDILIFTKNNHLHELKIKGTQTKYEELIEIKDNSINKLENKLKLIEFKLKEANVANELELEEKEFNITREKEHLQNKLSLELYEKEEIRKEFEQYKNETEKINLAIEKIKIPAIQLEESKEHYIESRTNYNLWATTMFFISLVMFFGTIYFFINIMEFNKMEKDISVAFYLLSVFPIILPTAIGFLFIRQVNINTAEIEKINKRFILIHEVNQSLQALVEVNRGKEMDGKTERIINKLIDNILDYASGNEKNKSESKDLDILALNDKVDRIIDTLDKKKTLFNIGNN
jgi:hypothetical protein